MIEIYPFLFSKAVCTSRFGQVHTFSYSVNTLCSAQSPIWCLDLIWALPGMFQALQIPIGLIQPRD